MVQFYGNSRSHASYVNEALGQAAEGLGRVGGEQYRYQQQRGRLQQALSSLDNLSPQQKKDPFQLTKAVLSATAGIPGAERYVGPLLESLMRAQGISASQSVAPPGQAGMVPGQGQASGQPGVQSFRQQAPSFANQGQQPTQQQPAQQQTPQQQSAQHPSAEAVNPTAVAPRRSTELIPPRQLMTPDQEIADAQRRAQELTAHGQPTTWEEQLPAVQAYNKSNAAYNQLLDAENKNIIAYRDKLQEEASKAYKQHIPDSEQSAPDLKRFQTYYLEGSDKTEPERFDYARRRIDALRAARANAKTFPDRPNWFKNIYRRLEGSERTAEQAFGEMHGILKPLLDMGEFQEARNIALNTFGLGPDETERVIHPMTPSELKQVNSIPQAKKRIEKAPAIMGGFQSSNVPNEKNIETLKGHIESLIKTNPDISLIQTRNIVGKKGYDWREFSQAVQQLQNEGKLSGLGQDTLNNIGQVFNPPIKGLGNIFEGIIFGKE